MEKMLGKVTSWTSRFQSYVGRTELLKSVLSTIQTFWAQVFVLPKKITQFIETICRRFLWTSIAEFSRKALIAREKLCCPLVASGISLINVSVE
uniref:Putative ovule protein n=1 Tax=Solanum chacoense TaxID=4108 RepID=A0A0V0GT60_SOLCH